MQFLLLLLLLVSLSDIEAAPLTNAQTFGAQHPDAFRNGTPGMIMVKGTSDNNSYMLEADPTTGAIPVSGTFSLGYDTNYGTAGSSTLRTAAQVGNATGAAAFNAGTTTAQTLRVVLPTDQTAVPATQSGTWTVQPGNTANTTAWLVNQNGRAYADSVINDYSSANVTSGTWVQVKAATAAAINWLTIFDSCGNALELGTGGSGSETRVLVVPPGGVTSVPLKIAASTRLSLRAIGTSCTSGNFILTGLQ